MLKNKSILIISPHIDDEAICSGGFIMKAKKEGAKVFVLYMANGKTRQFMNKSGQAPVQQRLIEARNASRFGGFEYKVVFEEDEIMKLDLLPQQALIEAIEDTMKELEPDIIVIPNRNSFNQDHRAVGMAAMTACRPLPSSLRPQASIILEMHEPYSWPMSQTANFYVDITEVFDNRIKLYKLYKTQLPQDPFPRSVANLVRLAGMRGCDIGVKYAEGYTLLRGQLL